MDLYLFNKIHGLAGLYPWFDGIGVFIAEAMIFVLVILIACLWFLKPSVRYRMAVVIAFASAIIARLVVVEIFHLFYHHLRPFLVLGFQPLISNDSWSFPSGHASAAFALATGVYLYDKKLGVISYVIALFIGLSRIYAGVHWPSDVLAGAVVGILTAIAIKRGAEKIIRSF
ncbi:MAG: membrane-associated phospholipid phosphatase [Parcubacteria group bacterium Licking1014_17]|nr:MAG: membrane-associated phospholipid phosphatase [Parcubacteria group bacterium Licking1014_17]